MEVLQTFSNNYQFKIKVNWNHTNNYLCTRSKKFTGKRHI